MGIDRYCTHICSPGRIHRPAPAESSPRSHSFRPHSSIQSSLLSLTPTCIVSSYSLPSLPLSLSSHSSFPPPFFFSFCHPCPSSLYAVSIHHPPLAPPLTPSIHLQGLRRGPLSQMVTVARQNKLMRGGPSPITTRFPPPSLGVSSQHVSPMSGGRKGGERGGRMAGWRRTKKY